MARKSTAATQPSATHPRDWNPPDTPPCSYLGCPRNAILRLKVGAGAVSAFCYEHYIAYHQHKADETCQRLNLTTPAEKRAWLLAAVRKLSAHMRPDYLTREPGSDDEPIP